MTRSHTITNTTSLASIALLTLTLVACADAGSGESPRGVKRDAGIVDMRGRPDAAAACGAPCTGKTGICDPASRKCVSCLVDGDCASQGPAPMVCRNKQCVAGCSANQPCKVGTCDLPTGACVGCANDVDCKAPTPYCDKASFTCVECTPMNDKCPAGQYCGMIQMNGRYACLAGCKTNSECEAKGEPTSLCCEHKCTDSAIDGKNCGACKTDCKTESCCDSICVGTDDNLFNCGGCGVVCGAQHAVPLCSGGFCQVGQCDRNYGDCDGSPNNGCETGLDDDSDHCGKCGRSCIFACLGGNCFPF